MRWLGGDGGKPTIDIIAGQTSGTAYSISTGTGTAFSANSVKLGTPHPTRVLIAATVLRLSGTPSGGTISGKIAGVTATGFLGAINLPFLALIFAANVPTGTTGDVDVGYTSSLTVTQAQGAIYEARFLKSSEIRAYASATNAKSLSCDLSVFPKGVFVALTAARSTGVLGGTVVIDSPIGEGFGGVSFNYGWSVGSGNSDAGGDVPISSHSVLPSGQYNTANEVLLAASFR